MIFQYPAAFLLLLPLAVWCFYRPLRSSTLNILRGCLLAVIVLALSDPRLRLPDRAGTVMVLVDRSRSMPGSAHKDAETYIRRLEAARPPDSRLGVISFAGDCVIEKLPEAPGFSGLNTMIQNPDSSDLSAALKDALRQIPENSPGRVVVISDGSWTGTDPARTLAGAAARRVAVDYHLLRRLTVYDLGITAVEAPLTAAPGETYTINCRIISPSAQKATCRIRRGESKWRAVELELHPGVNFVTWRDRGDAPGVADYTIEITGTNPELDEVPENNRARHLVQIIGRKPLLLLTQSPSGNLERILRGAGFDVTARPPSQRELTPAGLAGYSGVILENVPAGTLGLDGMSLTAGLVKSGALGLMMTGGRSSFALGGYYRSPIEEILPVSMEQRQEMRKSSLALVVALDRSGSMAMSIGNMTKMDMANLATLEVYRLMTPLDEFGVTAVDSQPHVVIPLSEVSSVGGAEGSIRSIESMGGGIFTYTAMLAGINELEKSKAKIRHLLLFADACDAEEPGSYVQLLERAARLGITVSVVGLGHETDPDAEFLKDIARRGNGLCYFSDRADELPRIFVQDTFTVARQTFIEKPTVADYTAAVRSLNVSRLGKSIEVGGYNLCYAKDGCETILVSRDDNHAPVGAIGQAELGRTAAFTAEADGEYTGKFADDPDAGTLLSAIANWVLVPEENRDFLLIQRQSKGMLQVELALDPARENDPWKQRPMLNAVIAKPGKSVQNLRVPFEWTAPDRMEAAIPLEGDAVYLGTVSWEGGRPLALAPTALACSPEFVPSESSADEAPSTAALFKMTGGHERFVPEEIWKELPVYRRLIDLMPLLLVLALLLLLLEVGERRLGLVGRWRGRNQKKRGTGVKVPRPAKRRKVYRVTASPAPSEPSPVLESAPPKAGPEPQSHSELGDALRRARRR